jgi:hypothetical protein
MDGEDTGVDVPRCSFGPRVKPRLAYILYSTEMVSPATLHLDKYVEHSPSLVHIANISCKHISRYQSLCSRAHPRAVTN